MTGKVVGEPFNPIPTATSMSATSTGADALSVTGVRVTGDGRMHSEGGIRLRGSGHVLIGAVAYGTVLDSAGGSKTITPAAVRTQTHVRYAMTVASSITVTGADSAASMSARCLTF